MPTLRVEFTKEEFADVCKWAAKRGLTPERYAHDVVLGLLPPWKPRATEDWQELAEFIAGRGPDPRDVTSS